MAETKKIAPILLTGMHHSGIEMIAHYLNKQGVFFGQQVISNDINVPAGYLEDVDFEQLQSRILTDGFANCKKGWPDWGYCVDGSFNYDIYQFHMERARDLLAEKNLTSIPWGWVDSRTTMLLDYWHELAPNAKYILVYRSPWEVKKAILDMDVEVFNKNPHFILAIWKMYNSKILEFYKNNADNCVLIDYTSFLKNPADIYPIIKNKLGVNLGKEFINDTSFYIKDIPGTTDTFEYLNEIKQDKECWDLLQELNKTADLPGYVATPATEIPVNKLSVIIATYNDAFLLGDALCSLEQMQNREYEIIIVNDGSNDERSLKKLKELASKGYKIINKQNGGASSARNLGIKECSGEYILILDADDIIIPGYIEEAVSILESSPETGVVYCSPRYAGDVHRYETMPEFSIERLISRNFICATSVFRKQAWEQAGGYDEALKGFDDWELWIHMAANGWKFHHINKYYFEYRLNSTSKTPRNSIPENRYNLLKHITTKHKALYDKYSVEVVSYLNKEQAELSNALKETHYQIHELNTQYNVPSNNGGGITGKLSKFKTLIKKVKHILMSPVFAPEEKRKWLQRLKYLFSSRGVMLVRKFFKVLFKYMFIILEHQKVTILLGDRLISQSKDSRYNYWLLKNAPREKDLIHFKENMQFMKYQPKISLVVPVYNSPIGYFKQMIESVKDQIYTNWELCIADDNSPNQNIRDLIKELAEGDSRIKYVFREENGHISACSNSAIEIATGEYVGLLDHDDLLTPDALYQVIFELNKHPETDLVYSDEDKIDDQGYLSEPHFKPDWCPDNLLTRNYITHFAVMRTSILKEIGGFREGFEGSQDYDLFLRYTEKTENIRHIPKVLYHWRLHGGSAAGNVNAKDYAYTAGERAIKEAIERRKLKGEVKMNGVPGYYQVHYEIEEKKKVSIIIPSKDKANILKVCLDSLYAKTTYTNFEVILIDNNSSEESFFNLVDEYKKKDNFLYFKHDIPFNYAELMNYAVERSNGEYLLLLNNDTEIIHGDWIERLVMQVQRESIGVAGAKLLYPNNTIQHAGVIIGLNGLAGHTFVGQSRKDVGYFNYLNVVSNYSAVTGACMMFRRDVYDAVNGFDEEFAIEYNDIDFCLRVKEQGYDNIFVPDVVLYHHESISRGNPLLNKKSIARHIFETDLFRGKWQKYIDHDPCYNPNLSKDRSNFEVGA